MTLEDRIRGALGSYLFQIAALETQLEQSQAQLAEARAKIAELEPPKEESPQP